MISLKTFTLIFIFFTHVNCDQIKKPTEEETAATDETTATETSETVGSAIKTSSSTTTTATSSSGAVETSQTIEVSPNNNSNSTVAIKLTDTDCVDPDLTKVATTTSLMLCDGTIAAGTLDLSAIVEESHADCSSDGQIGCVANTDFKAVDMSNVTAANIKSSVVLAGVTGSYTGAAACNTDGQTNCVANDNYKAAKMANFDATKLCNGVTVAGVAASRFCYQTNVTISGVTPTSVDKNAWESSNISVSITDDLYDQMTQISMDVYYKASNTNCTDGSLTGWTSTGTTGVNSSPLNIDPASNSIPVGTYYFCIRSTDSFGKIVYTLSTQTVQVTDSSG